MMYGYGGASPASTTQRFINRIANAEVGEEFTDPKGRTVRKVDNSSVWVFRPGTTIGDTMLIERYQMDLMKN